MRPLYGATLSVLLVGCTAATEPPIAQAPHQMCCGYVGNDWEDEGMAWSAGHALEAACACAGAKGWYGVRVVISPSGELVSAEPTFAMGADTPGRCVFDAITSSVRAYLASAPGEYPFELPTRVIDRRAARALWVPAPSCDDAKRYVALPERLQSCRFMRRRLAHDECRRPVEAVVAEIAVDLGER